MKWRIIFHGITVSIKSLLEAICQFGHLPDITKNEKQSKWRSLSLVDRLFQPKFIEDFSDFSDSSNNLEP